MASSEEVVRVKEEVQDRLLATPGVMGVGMGPKISGGQATGELAILVFVEKKVAGPPEGQLIPSEIQGVKTDVLPGALAEADQGDEGESYNDRRKIRQKEGGLRGGLRVQGPGIIVSNENASSQSSNFQDPSQVQQQLISDFGTLACIARQGNLIVALTNAHVANPLNFRNKQETPKQQHERLGTKVGQPTDGDSCSDCCSDIIGTVLKARFDPETDGATVLLKPGLHWADTIEDIGLIAGHRVVQGSDPDLLAMNVVVRKRGARTLLTRGVVRSVMYTSTQDRTDPLNPATVLRLGPFTNQMLVYPTPPFKEFGNHGDSGSAYTDLERRVIGLHWGSGAPPDAPTATWRQGIGSPIARVMSDLSITIPPGQAGVHVVPATNVPPGQKALLASDEPYRTNGALTSIQDRLASSPTGSEYLALMNRHQAEVRYLIRSQVRVAAVWKRREGARLGGRLLSAAYAPDAPVFDERDLPNAGQALEDILSTLERYGSAELCKDIALMKPIFVRWSSYSMSQIMAEMEGAGNLAALHGAPSAGDAKGLDAHG